MTPELTAWLREQDVWLQIAATRLLCNRQLSNTDIEELSRIIKNPMLALDAQPGTAIPPQVMTDGAELRLISIGSVEGIDALRPRAPLNFGNENLVVIYGHNGSGKSGYTRIICKACGKPHPENLRNNVFAPPPPVRQTCKISYTVGGVHTEVEWTPAAPIEALSAVDVFDTASGRIYLENETEVAFVPPDLSLMADLVKACNRIDAVFLAEQQRLVTALPTLPADLTGTAVATAYLGLTHATTEGEIYTLAEWTLENVQELDALNAALAVADPISSAKKRLEVKRQREMLAHAVSQSLAQLTGAAVELTRGKVTHAADMRRIANEAAEALKSKSAVVGVGTETWRRMWSAAREFAAAEAYPSRDFPLLEPGARCVLCHQELSDAARDRLAAFESYVSGKIQLDATSAERQLAEHLAKIASRPSADNLQTAAQAAELDPQLATLLEECWAELEANLNPLRRGGVPCVDYTPSEKVTRVIDLLHTLARGAETEADVLTRSADPVARQTAESRRKELRAKKWISEQSTAIRTEVERLKRLQTYQQWRRQTTTTGLSRKAGELSETLVTEAYIQRFNAELAHLGAHTIRVELVKTRTERGRAKHGIRLRNATAIDARISDILSEGERRIISLAAFLADVTGRATRSPFIFDDPISSLDQIWEERTIDRLIELSASRQVIVFTHRLSLLGIITDKAGENLNSIHIRRETWGTGEPGEVPLFGKNTRGALNQLKNDRLARARRVLTEHGHDVYYPLGKAICSDIRILTERLVEVVLLADVIQRHRRDIKTRNLIHQLSKITAADCALIDEFMTRYSRYEHSQSNEAPVELPQPTEIGADIDRLLIWQTEFSTRAI